MFFFSTLRTWFFCIVFKNHFFLFFFKCKIKTLKTVKLESVPKEVENENGGKKSLSH